MWNQPELSGSGCVLLRGAGGLSLFVTVCPGSLLSHGVPGVMLEHMKPPCTTASHGWTGCQGRHGHIWWGKGPKVQVSPQTGLLLLWDISQEALSLKEEKPSFSPHQSPWFQLWFPNKIPLTRCQRGEMNVKTIPFRFPLKRFNFRFLPHYFLLLNWAFTLWGVKWFWPAVPLHGTWGDKSPGRGRGAEGSAFSPWFPKNRCRLETAWTAWLSHNPRTLHPVAFNFGAVTPLFNSVFP